MLNFYSSIVLIIFLFSIQLVNAQSKFNPKHHIFNSAADWRKTSNWNLESGSSSLGYPTSNDIVHMSTSGTYKQSITINFNLDEISDNLSLILANSGQTFTVNQTANATLSSIRSTNSGQILTVHGTLTINGDLTYTNGGGTTIAVCGLLKIHGGNLDADQGLKIKHCGIADHDHGQIIVEADSDGNGGDLNYKCQSSDFDNSNVSIGIDGDCDNGCNYASGNDFCGDIDLPVSLTYFKGQQTSKGNLLIWETASEQNSSHFEVQSSNNKANWKTIGRVEAGGNSNVTLKYEFLDINYSGKYYRLVQHDFDGKKEYFGIVTFVDTENSFQCKAYPSLLANGVDLTLEIHGADANNPIVGVFYSTKGKVLSHDIVLNNAEGNIITLYKVPKVLQKGVYILRISNGRNTSSNKIVIE
ncbi:T9SS type A sorting domain-containing protein [Flammeovirga kamogawensis]|uniref:T9SS type A sorting domain-containing protein n=1 Tax=Flammeovirga kamogawensis TaxID=373891 RepID=A0ABX8GXW0_9BACT|nr:T9SS type A sorting domain-containing protein [Flammeovirga kamogawensis]MBB6462837.1 hypothetical protein [Flammeovirga kamogawensis]QWG08381.1 T9SS type A sorting domain-containing protein [Flammeovirga kamogawensis]TRX66676.1 T9SS type A sorting domain-containing protein [Flammeovirga kamogawensis]